MNRNFNENENLLRHQLWDSKIPYFQYITIVSCDENIFAFHVAVHDTLLVNMVQSRENLAEEIHNSLENNAYNDPYSTNYEYT